MQENLQQGINRSKRHQFLDGVVKGCQQILGLLYGTMPHDAAWYFLRLGRNLERADMTTRIVDAGVAAVLSLEEDDTVVNSRQIIWGNVLRSAGADQSYRRTVRTSVKGEAVLNYLLEDPAFPRSIHHCLAAIADSAAKLPRSRPVVTSLQELQATVFEDVNYDELGMPLRDYLNELQLKLATIHSIIANRWFPTI